jgi:hypothetical protein
MLFWFGVLAFIGAGLVVIRWLGRRVDSLGRLRPFPWISVSLLLLLGIGFLTPYVLRIRLEHKLAAAASEFVGSPVEIHCQTFGEAFVDLGVEDGFVAFGPDGTPEKRALIKRDQCGVLSDYLRSDKATPTREEAIAVHILSHESVHMTGLTDEAETECLAVQRDAEMARLLGAPAEGAEALARTYFDTVYPSMPEEYRKDDCALGASD